MLACGAASRARVTIAGAFHILRSMEEPRIVKAGDVLCIAAGTPHGLSAVNGLMELSIHTPRGAGTTP